MTLFKCPECHSRKVELIRYDGLYLIMVLRCECGHQWQENMELD